MNERNKWERIRGLSIPVLAILFVICALTGCGRKESGQTELGSFSGFFNWGSSVDISYADGSSGSASSSGQEDELLILVNPWNPVPEGYEVELHTLSDGTQVAEVCMDDLRRLLEDCRAAGGELYICSAYRTWEYQAMLFENKVARLMGEGLDEASAREQAATVVALPGTSEHELGLALDIIDANYLQLDEGQEATFTQQWLMENSWRYGFILRYPEGKSEVTGIIYEPWHYRYVGAEHAKEIYESGLCFEEWLERR